MTKTSIAVLLAILMTKLLSSCCALLVASKGSRASAISAAVSQLEPQLPKRNFYSLPEPELIELLQSWGYPSYRVKQLHEAVYQTGRCDFESINILPADLRNRLAAHLQLGSLTVTTEMLSKDGTIKRVYQLPDSSLIESVLMPYDDGRRTACISSQVGCAMKCVFCATGQMGFSRQLLDHEIFQQAQYFSQMLKEKGERLSNVVLMGMGEPLNNYKNVVSAVHRLNKDLGIGMRHITISTVGIVPRIRQLATDLPQVGLAISLHQADDKARTSIMPVNKRYPIAELMEACKYHISVTGRRITFEWALISNLTDKPETAHQLGKLISGMQCHVNVIPVNPTAGFFGVPSTKKQVNEFINILAQYGIPATQRVKRGIDIAAGCGQLRADLIKGTASKKDELQL